MAVSPTFRGTRAYFDEVARMLDAILPQMPPFVDAIYAAYLADQTVFLIGNGGSAANASHFGQDLSKGTASDLVPGASKRIRALPLTDHVSYITAAANDLGYEQVFVQQLATHARAGDSLIAISGSGNSPNVIRAVEYAKAHQVRTVGVTGFSGGALKPMCDVNVHVPSDDMGLVEAIHSVLFHATMSELAARLG